MEDVILTAVIQELPADEGGGFWGFVEEIPGAISQGETLDEVRTNLREAVTMVLEYQREHAKESLDPAAVRTIREQIRVTA